ncbi:MAG: SDR family oxidoreductase [Acidobacteriota bacterium]
MNILVTGATGYIGGRLIPGLLKAGHSVRAFVRDPARIKDKPWVDAVEVAEGDLADRGSVERACAGMDAAYFLVHAMYSGGDFADKETKFAENFAAAAAGMQKVIYLGGLQPKGDSPSTHLKSRERVGEILAENGNVTEFRAGPIIGSGSASFEMVRYLTERLPIMIVPRWVRNNVQSIAVRNVIQYLIAALDKEPLGVVEIGSDVLSFRGMMESFAEVRGLKRWIIPVPVLTPLLSGLWVGLITPVPNALAVPLVEGILDPVTADTSKAKKHFPRIEPMNYREAVEIAIRKTAENATETRWTDSLGDGGTYKFTDKDGLFKEIRAVDAKASPHSVFRSFTSIGGDKGWLAWGWAWKVRGLLDNLVGGPGLKRGRRNASDLRIGDALDFWRVEDLVKDKMVLLRAEMKVPGKAWLMFEAVPKGDITQLVQIAIFEPKGFLGVLYWYSLFPIHSSLFRQMAARIALGAEALESDMSKMPNSV